MKGLIAGSLKKRIFTKTILILRCENTIFLAKKTENLLTVLFLKLIHKRRVLIVSEVMFENFYSSKVVFFLKK